MGREIDKRGLLLGGLGLATAGMSAFGAQARQAPVQAQRVQTASQIEGPFYPYDLPQAHDADLVRMTGGDADAMGRVTHVFGTVWTTRARPLGGALVEIWQCDANGRYRHPEDLETSRTPDMRFQGYGRAIAGPSGAFRFRTIQPVSYSVAGTSIVRAPHIHLAVSTRGVRRLTTQLYIAGESLNETDGQLSLVTNAAQRDGLIRPYTDGSDFEAGALMVNYDLMVII